MKLTAFRIQNFRSVIDSKLTKLSTDNITALIGQNESGKTSVLEALRSFYSGSISEDVLRSDNNFPEITCCFQLSNNESIEDMVNMDHIPEEIQKIIIGKDSFCLTRKWEGIRKSHLYLNEDRINAYFNARDKRIKQFELTINSNIKRIIEKYEQIEKVLNKFVAERANVKKKIHEVKNAQLKAGLKRQKPTDTDQQIIDTLTKQLTDCEENINQLKQELLVIEEKYQLSKKYTDLVSQLGYFTGLVETELHLFSKYNGLVKFSGNLLERRLNKRKALTHRNKLKEAKRKLEQSKIQEDTLKRVLYKLFDGIQLHDAENQVKLENLTKKSPFDIGTLAHQLFNYLPAFSFFEDFSSLLPDRIDLEDLYVQKKNLEGHKAVSNFFRILDLEKDFFHDDNQRILKQKIENLNGQLTLDFQEFWRQNIGKGNKIHLGFDLEHFGDEDPDKKGKPFLEFWIKDNHERLYPKQRSRGVRWFLSFYLELKATSLDNKQKVLLIDEPGLSLHARAQEDVLKVFEDVKQNVQIIYSTHSPQLIDSNKLYRVLAIQRNLDAADNSSSIFDVANIRKASADTLTPIYSTMGAFDKNNVEIHRNNLVVEDIANYYLLNSIIKLSEFTKDINIIPSTGIENIPLLANILLGWNTQFKALLPDTEAGFSIRNQLMNTIYLNDEDRDSKIAFLEDRQSVFDVFSTIDFKKYILNKRIGITESNTDYLNNNDYSTNQLASAFASKVQEASITMNDFDYETSENIKELMKLLYTLF